MISVFMNICQADVPFFCRENIILKGFDLQLLLVITVQLYFALVTDMLFCNIVFSLSKFCINPPL